MFTIGYVLAIVVVLIPMILSYASTGRFPAVPLRRVILLAAIVPGIVCFEAALRISLEYYWFSELGKTPRSAELRPRKFRWSRSRAGTSHPSQSQA